MGIDESAPVAVAGVRRAHMQVSVSLPGWDPNRSMSCWHCICPCLHLADLAEFRTQSRFTHLSTSLQTVLVSPA